MVLKIDQDASLVCGFALEREEIDGTWRGLSYNRRTNQVSPHGNLPGCPLEYFIYRVVSSLPFNEERELESLRRIRDQVHGGFFLRDLEYDVEEEHYSVPTWKKSFKIVPFEPAYLGRRSPGENFRIERGERLRYLPEFVYGPGMAPDEALPRKPTPPKDSLPWEPNPLNRRANQSFRFAM